MGTTRYSLATSNERGYPAKKDEILEAGFHNLRLVAHNEDYGSRYAKASVGDYFAPTIICKSDKIINLRYTVITLIIINLTVNGFNHGYSRSSTAELESFGDNE